MASRTAPIYRGPKENGRVARGDAVLGADGHERAPASANATTEDRPDSSDARASRPRRPGLVTLFPRAADAAPASWRVAKLAGVGRGNEAEVRLVDGRVSRAHATVEPRPVGLFVRDLGSRHGSFVNGEHVGVAGALASAGDVVRFGETLLLVVDDVERHRSPPRRMEGARLGLPGDMFAGPLLAEVWDQAGRLGELFESVLILGETGTGKECVARILHAHGAKGGPFVGVNIAAIPQSLFEAELFGYERGAFTGATVSRPGAFRDAADGTIFLDEVGELLPELQAKLLRALDLRSVRSLGADRDAPISARIVAATNRDLREACEAGSFRADLWYRLSASVIHIPPLRERRDDIILLALQFLREQGRSLGLTTDAAEVLLLAEWEGNARQLRHVLGQAGDRASAGGDVELRPNHLPALEPLLDRGGALTAKRIETAMLKAGGVASRAARSLGISRSTLYSAMKRLNVQRDSVGRH